MDIMDNRTPTSVMEKNVLTCRDCSFTVKIDLPERATAEQRKVVRAMFESAMGISSRILDGTRPMKLKVVLPLYDQMDGLIVIEDSPIDLGISLDPVNVLLGMTPDFDPSGIIEYASDYPN